MSALLSWLRSAPPGTTVPADSLAVELQALLATGPALVEAAGSVTPPAPTTWREKLWTVPAETRLGVREVAEAIGRPASWVYRRTGDKSQKARLPHRKLDSELVFLAGEVRAWLESHEESAAPVFTGQAYRRGKA